MEEFNLKQIFNIFWKRRIAILIILILTISIGAIKSFKVNPMYKSEAKLLLIPVNNEITNNGIEYIADLTKEELALNSKLVSSYNEFFKSNEILKEIADELNIDGINVGNLKNNIYLIAINDTGMMKITATSTNATHAAKIANKAVEVFSEMIADTFIDNNIRIVSEAEVNTQPFNINHKKDITVSALIAIVIIFGYVLVRYLWDSSKEIM